MGNLPTDFCCGRACIQTAYGTSNHELLIPPLQRTAQNSTSLDHHVTCKNLPWSASPTILLQLHLIIGSPSNTQAHADHWPPPGSNGKLSFARKAIDQLNVESTPGHIWLSTQQYWDAYHYFKNEPVPDTMAMVASKYSMVYPSLTPGNSSWAFDDSAPLGHRKILTWLTINKNLA